MRQFLYIVIACLVSLLPIRAEAQYFGHRCGGAPIVYQGSYQSYSYAPPIMQPYYVPPIVNYAPSVTYIAPAPIYRAAEPQIYFSTFRVDEIVSSCRLRDDDRIEICDGIQLLDPRSYEANRILLRQIANLLVWGWGYSVVARFTHHASGVIDAIASAAPIAAGYTAQPAVSGHGPSTTDALQDALSQIGANLVR